MLRVGLTGGIASGKSTVANMFAARGAHIIDTDIIAREVVEPGKPALGEIEAAFGLEVMNDDGSLKRNALRKIVFADAARRRQLESILHPKIRDESLLQASRASGAYLIIVVPLLVDSPMQDSMHRILVVDCDEEAQLNRLLVRDTEDKQQAMKIIAAQASREQRLAIADDVITNDGNLAETERQVEALHQQYLSL
jgi:dephospho-CoA kinase